MALTSTKSWRSEITPVVLGDAFDAAWATLEQAPTMKRVYDKFTSLAFTDISGTLAIAKGGTGQTSAAAAFNALSPVTILGDLIYGSGAAANSRLPGNTAAAKRFLTQTGTGSTSAAPAWGTIVAGDVPSLDASKITTGTLGTARLGSGTASTSTFLRGDSTWQAISFSPAGSNTQVQYNGSGAFAASSNLTFDGTKLNVGAGSSTTSFEVQRADNTNYAAVIGNAGGVGRALKLTSGNFSSQKIFLVEVAGSEIFSLQAGGGPTVSMTTADNTNYTASFKNTGGSGKALYLETGGFSTQGVLQVNSGGTNIFRINSNGTPAYFDVDAADNSNFVGYLRNTGGTGRILKLVTASSSNTIPVIEALGSTSTSIFSLFASGDITTAGNLTIGDGKNLILGTTTGTKFGNSTTAKWSFANQTPTTSETGWTAYNHTPTKDFDASSDGLPELINLVCTLVNSLKTKGLILA